MKYDSEGRAVIASHWDAIQGKPESATLYAGFVDGSAGASVTAIFNDAASAWSVSQQATGRFRVTHSLNLANVKHLSVIATASINAGGTDDRLVNITNETADYFEVHVFDTGAGDVNDDFYFQATRLVAA